MEAEKYSREPLTAFRKQFLELLNIWSALFIDTWLEPKETGIGTSLWKQHSVAVFNTVLGSFICILIIPSSSEDVGLVFLECNA